MGFWASLMNYLERQREADRQQRIMQRERNERLASIREEEQAKESGRIAAQREDRQERYGARQNRPQTFDTSFWDPPRYSPRATSDAWFGEPERKKKRRQQSFW